MGFSPFFSPSFLIPSSLPSSPINSSFPLPSFLLPGPHLPLPCSHHPILSTGPGESSPRLEGTTQTGGGRWRRDCPIQPVGRCNWRRGFASVYRRHGDTTRAAQPGLRRAGLIYTAAEDTE
ncbi:unnamed protein product [Eretmochelys imbricata]